jgi:hypothetical protein
MGIERMGPPEELVLLLGQELDARTLVETGTYQGQTAAWAAWHFERVVTVEAAPELHREAATKYGALANVEFVLGDSRDVLTSLVSALVGPSLFWLDSHWSGGSTCGAFGECPLLDELDAIRASPHEHAILIDDARMFESAPPLPHDPAEWPSIDRDTPPRDQNRVFSSPKSSRWNSSRRLSSLRASRRAPASSSHSHTAHGKPGSLTLVIAVGSRHRR